MHKLIRVALFAFIAVAFAACNKDNTAPIIVILSPDQDTHFQPGDSVTFEAMVHDNQMLAEFSFEVGDRHGNEIEAFGHTHLHVHAEGTEPQRQVYTFVIPASFSGQAFYVHVHAMDASENSSSKAHRLQVD